MAAIPHQGGETVLLPNPGHFERGIWKDDKPEYGLRVGRWEPCAYSGRFANLESVDDPRFGRFQLLLIFHIHNDPKEKVQSVCIGTTDDPDEAVKLSEVGLNLYPFCYHMGDYLQFQDRLMMLSWDHKLGGP